MTTISVRLPNSLRDQLRACAKRDGTTVNQLVSSAVAEKLSALLTEEYLEARAKRGSRKKFEAALRTVPDVEPAANDRLPKKAASRGSRPRS
ncbi:MAG: toxin-antitoxin system HicB family antitoxin [Planctomycetaceae bacterium]